MKFLNMICANINCLMYVFTPDNTFSIKSNITIKTLSIKSTSIESIDKSISDSVTASLIRINSVGNVSLTNIVIINS